MDPGYKKLSYQESPIEVDAELEKVNVNLASKYLKKGLINLWSCNAADLT